MLNLTIAGEGYSDSPGDPFLMQVGDVTLWPPGIVHDYRAGPEGIWHHDWIYFFPRDTWHDLLRWPARAPGVFGFHIEDQDIWSRLTLLMQQLLDIGWLDHPTRIELQMSLLKTMLLWIDVVNPERGRTLVDARIRRAIEIISQSYHESLTLDYMARKVGLSTSRLSHLFREETGVSPLKYIEQHRLYRACHLLHMTLMPISDIAREVGYEDAAYFSSIFRRTFKRTPRQFRAENH